MNEKWTKSPVGGTVISDTPNREPLSSELQKHEEAARAYYGGHLVAESIPKKAFVDLIAAAPDLYEALWAILYADQDNQIDGDLFQQAKAALDKAKGES